VTADQHHRLAKAFGQCGFTVASRVIQAEHHRQSHQRAVALGVPPDQYGAWMDNKDLGPSIFVFNPHRGQKHQKAN
jgi:hypothetical protein